MNLRAEPALFFLLAASCAPSPEALEVPRAPERRDKDDEVVAFHDGRPLSWRAVAEKALDLDLKYAVDQYIRWKILEDRRTSLGIANAPEELRRRAETFVRQTREGLGEARFKEQLDKEGFTEERYARHVQGLPWLDETLALEKIVRYATLREDALEIDRMVFADAGDARKFLDLCREKTYDKAADEFKPEERKKTIARLPRETFPRSRPPSRPEIDPALAERLFKMSPGEWTDVQPGPSGLHYVIQVLKKDEGRNVSYKEARAEILEGILKDPPPPQDCRRWIEGEFNRSKIEYANRNPRGNKIR